MARARKIALSAFVLVVIGAVVTEFDTLRDAFGEIAVAVVTLNLLAMSVSFLIARAAKLDDRQSTAIAMELGVHNTTVALAIATSVNDELAGPAAVYGLLMFVTAGAFARFMARRNAERAPVVEETADGGVEVVAEVRGEVDDVWRAVATAPGLGAWLAPTRIDDGRIVLDLGKHGHAYGEVVVNEAPFRFGWVEPDWRDGAPPLLTEFQLEDDGGGWCRVRVINRVEGEPDAGVQAALGAAEAAWSPALLELRQHLA